jgi:hypothetical protein
MRAATCSSPVAQRLRFSLCKFIVEQGGLGPGDQVRGGQRELEPGGVDREHPGRNRPRPVSLPQRMRSSTVACARCRVSSAASCPAGVSVAKAWNRQPWMSVKVSWAPGCGRSRRTITRIRSGQPRRPGRAAARSARPPRRPRAAIHRLGPPAPRHCGRAKIAVCTCSVMVNPTENDTSRPRSSRRARRCASHCLEQPAPSARPLIRADRLGPGGPRVPIDRPGPAARSGVPGARAIGVHRACASRGDHGRLWDPARLALAGLPRWAHGGRCLRQCRCHYLHAGVAGGVHPGAGVLAQARDAVAGSNRLRTDRAPSGVLGQHPSSSPWWRSARIEFEMPVPVSMVSRRSDVSSYLVHVGIELGQHNIPRPITVRAVQLSPLSPERLPPLSVCGAGAEDWIA